jgi:hypothetical protein
MPRIVCTVIATHLLTISLPAFTGPAQVQPGLIGEVQPLQECHVVATVQNRGPGALPDTAWQDRPTIQFYKEGAGFGGRLLLDAELENLRQPGATTTITATRKIQGSAELRVHVDASNQLAETNENNNSMTRRITCTTAGGKVEMRPVAMVEKRGRSGSLPDLAVTAIVARPIVQPTGPQPDLAVSGIGYDEDCRVTVTIRNQGTAELVAPETLADRPDINLTIGGQPAGGFALGDLTMQELSAPGGTALVTHSGARWTISGTRKIEVYVSAGTVSEANEANNEGSAVLTCLR